MSSQSLCEDLFLYDIISKEEFENQAFFEKLCFKLDTDLVTTLEELEVYINKQKFKNNYEEAFCYLLHAVTAHRLNKSSIKYVSIKKAYNLSNKIQDPLLRVIIIGTYAVNLREYNVSDNIILNLFNEALLIAEELPANYNSIRFYQLNEIGKIYLKNKQYSQAISYFIKAKDYIKSSSDVLILSSGYNNIGYGYHMKKDYEKALEYFEKSLKLLDVKNPIHLEFKANLYENFAHVYGALDNRDKAIEYYRRAINISQKVKNEIVEIRATLAMILLFDDFSKSDIIPKQIEEKITLVRTYFKTHKNELTSIHFNGLVEKFHKFLVRRSQERNISSPNISFEAAWEDYEVYIKEFNSVNIKASNIVTEDYVTMMNNYYDQLIIKEKHEKKIAMQKQLGIIILLILIILIVAILLRNRTLKLATVKGKNKIVEIEKSMIQQRLEFKNEDVINLSNQLSMVLSLKKNVVDKITALSEKEVTKESLNKLLQELKMETSIEDRLHVLKSDITKLNSQFLRALMNKYPNLSKTEREICSLIRLNLSTKEIAMIRNTSVNAVKMNRSRIRRKMQLEKHEELDKQIVNIK